MLERSEGERKKVENGRKSKISSTLRKGVVGRQADILEEKESEIQW
jgi:hypothetical protein